MTNDQDSSSSKIIKASQLLAKSANLSENTSSSAIKNTGLAGLIFIELEKLDQTARQFIDQIQSILANRIDLKLTCIGCYKSNQDWDYRPVFVAKSDSGSLFLLRIIIPDNKLNPSLEMAWRNLASTLNRTYLASGLDQFACFNTESRIYWCLRKFYPHTLDPNSADSKILEDSLSDNPKSESGVIICTQELLQELHKLEDLLCPHGNIIKSNLGFDGQRLFLLDPWIYSASKKSTASPDKSANIGPRALASLLLKFFGNNMPVTARQLLLKFISSDSDNLSFSDLYSTWQSVYSNFSVAQNDPQQELANQHNINTSEQTAYNPSQNIPDKNLAPRGKVIQSGAIKSGPNLSGTKRHPVQHSSPASDTSVESSSAESTLPAENSSFKNSEPASSGARTKLANRPLFLPFIIALAAAVLVLSVFGNLNFNLQSYSNEQLISEWQSEDRELIAQLAEEAIVERRTQVQDFIALQLLNGKDVFGTDSNFIKVAFNPLWYDQLSKKDRIFALSVAMSSVYKTPSDSLPEIDELSPALVFALIGKLKLTHSDARLSEISIDKLVDLPGSFGSVFKGLKELGYSSIADPSVRAAARIISNNFDADDFNILLSPQADENHILRIASLIAPFSESNPDIAELLFEKAATRQDLLGSRLRWFTSEPLAEWQKATSKDLLFIALGLLPESITQIDKLSDLLLYPNQRVRQKTAEKIITVLNASYLQDLLNMFIVNPNVLSRTQAIGLIAINQSPGDKSAPFVASWLDLQPDAGVVLEFLISTRNIKSFEQSSIQLANYLARKDFDISQKQLPLLLSHPEALARTLAFPRLDPNVELDRKILQAWYQTETLDRIKNEIRLKLNQKR